MNNFKIRIGVDSVKYTCLSRLGLQQLLELVPINSITRKNMIKRNTAITMNSSGVMVCPKSEQKDEKRTTNVTDGIVNGIVISNNDPEYFNRVKVRFPWLHSPNNETDWIRVRSFTTPKEREYTNYYQLDIGDKVLVAFDRGDFRHPHIIGVIWDDESTVTSPLIIESEREIQTPRKKNSSIGDREDYQHITADRAHKVEIIHAKRGDRIFFEGNSSDFQEIMFGKSNSEEKAVGKDQEREELECITSIIKIDSHLNSISIETQQDLHIKAPNVEIEASKTMRLKSGETMTINGSIVNIN
jgi:uncharacterized protein involved in type VI secretion and phage assembly